MKVVGIDSLNSIALSSFRYSSNAFFITVPIFTNSTGSDKVNSIAEITMASYSIQDASDFVEKIRRRNGGITEEERRTWPSDALDMISNLRQQLASSTRT